MLQGFHPCGRMLVDAVDQGAVDVEDHCPGGARSSSCAPRLRSPVACPPLRPPWEPGRTLGRRVRNQRPQLRGVVAHNPSARVPFRARARMSAVGATWPIRRSNGWASERTSAEATSGLVPEVPECRLAHANWTFRPMLTPPQWAACSRQTAALASGRKKAVDACGAAAVSDPLSQSVAGNRRSQSQRSCLDVRQTRRRGPIAVAGG